MPAFKFVDTSTVVLVDWRENAAQDAVALGHLDEHERELRLRFLNDPPRWRSALCRAAMRAIVCDRLGCANKQVVPVASTHGKTVAFAVGSPASFSFNM